MRKMFVLVSAFILSFAPSVLAQETAADMPIADLHFHAEKDVNPDRFAAVLERTGVRWFGSGERQGGPPVLRAYKEAFGDRLIAFGGQSWMNVILLRDGLRAIENPDNTQFKQVLAYLDAELAAKRIVGAGELFVNNRSTNQNERMRRKMNITGEVITSLYELTAKHGAFMTFHMEGDADSVEHLEKLLASNRKGRIILNHCGVSLPPKEMDRLFSTHPNLFCEVSVRYPPMIRSQRYTQIFDGRAIASGWKDVIVKHADRFMIGTDAEANDAHYEDSIRNVRSGLLANLPIEAAQKVAYKNAIALFGLK